MEEIFKVKHNDKLDLMFLSELAGTYSLKSEDYLQDKVNGLGRLHDICRRSNFYKVMYLYDCGPACESYFCCEHNQVEILLIISRFLEVLDDEIKSLDDASSEQLIDFNYAYYYALYVKDFLTDFMKLTPEICQKYRVYNPTLPEIFECAKAYMSDNRDALKLYRILAKFMCARDEYTSALQLLDMICNKYGENTDIINKYVINLCIGEYEIEDVNITLNGIDSPKAHILKAEYLVNEVHNESDWDKYLKELETAYEELTCDTLESFSNYVDLISAIRQIVDSLDNGDRKEKWKQICKEKTEEGMSDGRYCNSAKTYGFTYKEYMDMVIYFLKQLDEIMDLEEILFEE